MTRPLRQDERRRATTSSSSTPWSSPSVPPSIRCGRWASAPRARGFDQLIAIEPSDTADAFMRVWNADGSMVETCGNALRCVGWLLMQANGADKVLIDTAGGPATATRAGDHRVTVDMGRPRLDWTQAPLAEAMDTRGIELQVGPIDDPVLHTPGVVSMGNPHVVFFTDRQDDAFVTGSGSLVEHHPLFPQGVNVGFANVLDRDHIRLRVWERGAGLTKACGTGACAAPGRHGPARPDRPQGDRGRGRRRTVHRLGRRDRSCPDDRPGRDRAHRRPGDLKSRAFAGIRTDGRASVTFFAHRRSAAAPASAASPVMTGRRAISPGRLSRPVARFRNRQSQSERRAGNA